VKRTSISFRGGPWTLLFGRIAVGFVAAYFLAPLPGDSTGILPPGSEGTAMTRKAEGGTATRSAAIPPIDASLPGVTETATFALG
jgi:hypothetical protein